MHHRHQLFGHVFSGRYQALLVEGDGNGCLKSVCDYVHLNPVRPGLFKSKDRLTAYPWNSLVWYAAGRVRFGTFRSANSNPHRWMKADPKPRGDTNIASVEAKANPA